MSDTEPKICAQCGAPLGSGQCPACQPGPTLDAAETLAAPRDPAMPDQTIALQPEPPQPPLPDTEVPAAETVIGQPPAPPSPEPAPESAVEKQIGPYTVGQRLGDGGMGEVFIAEQQEPVKRQVALKIIKLGMDSTEVLRRFEAERQALAMMDHPNIAHVYDAGTAPSGRPYFVMELVRGIPLTDYCDRNRLTPAERLELFVTVCEAIQHAHQRGIIHRDLKPSNILVEEVDGVPTPKVIDFGIAKAVDQDLTERTLETQVGDLLGTPQYMSPEQALGNIQEIDTRSDVYSLGVILYELLTGEPPISAGEIQEAGILGVGKLLSEKDPQRPSTRLISRGKEARTVAEQRGTDPSQLSRSLKRELDWVTLKCLEKERDRRYDTASALAQDLERHLADRVVEARPPSAGYRFRKMVRRNRAAFSAATVVLLAILAGAGLAVWQAIEATRAQQETAELLAESYAENGWEALEKGDASLALLWQAEALRRVDQHGGLAPGDELPYQQRVAWALDRTSKPVAVIERPFRIDWNAIWMDPGTNRVFLSFRSKAIEVWDLASGKLEAEQKARPPHTIPAVDRSGRRFALRNGKALILFTFDDPVNPVWSTELELDEGIGVANYGFSFDGKYLVALDTRLVVSVLSVDTGELLRTIDLGNGQKRSSAMLTLSDRDYRLATYSASRSGSYRDRWLVVADVDSGEILFRNDRDGRGFDLCDAGALSPDGKAFVLAENTTRLSLFDLEAGDWLSSQLNFASGNNPRRVLFPDTGGRIYSFNMGMINGWSWPDQEHLFLQQIGFVGLELNGDREDRLLTRRADQAFLLDAGDGEISAVLPESGPVGPTYFLDEGRLVVTARYLETDSGAEHTRLTFWRPESRALEDEVLPLTYARGAQRMERLEFATLDSGSNRLATLLEMGAVVWDLEEGEMIYRYRTPSHPAEYVRSARLLAGGRELAVSDFTGMVRVLDVETGQVRHDFTVDGQVRRLDASPGGRWLAAKEAGPADPADPESRVVGRVYHFWRLPGGELSHRIPAATHADRNYGVEFSPDDRYALIHTGERNRSESGRGELTLLDLDSGETLTYQEDPDAGLRFEWRRGSDRSSLHRFAFVDKRTFVMGRTVGRIGPEGGLTWLGQFPDSARGEGIAKVPGRAEVVLISQASRSFRLWDVETLTPVSPPIRHGSDVSAVAVHPNGRTVASAGFSGDLRLWDAPTGKAVSPWFSAPERSGISGLLFTADGSRLLSLGSLGDLMLWKLPAEIDAPAGDLVRVAEGLARRRLDPLGQVMPLTDGEVMVSWAEPSLSAWTRTSLPAPDEEEEGEDWISLFDGRTLDGWEKSHPEARGIRVQQGLLRLVNQASWSQRLRFVGKDGVSPQFQNFRLRFKIWTRPGCDAVLFLHADEQPLTKDPRTGHAIVLKPGPGSGQSHVGSLAHGIQKVEAPFVAEPERWHEMEVEVRGNRLITRIDGRTASWWQEPEGWKGPYSSGEQLDERGVLSSGAFVFRISKGALFLKDIEVQRLDPEEG